MNNFNKRSVILGKIFRFILLILFFFALVFIVKWRIDSMYLNSISRNTKKVSLIDEFKVTKNEILIAAGLREEEKNTPVAIEEDSENSEEINENTLTIPEGTDANALADILLARGYITDVNAYNFLLDDMQIRDKIVPGNYEIPEGAKAKEVLAQVTNTELKEFNITIAEGSTLEENANMLKEVGIIESPYDFVLACNNLGVTALAPGEHTIVEPTRVNTIINQLKQNI